MENCWGNSLIQLVSKLHDSFNSHSHRKIIFQTHNINIYGLCGQFKKVHQKLKKIKNPNQHLKVGRKHPI